MTKQDWDTLQEQYEEHIFGVCKLRVGDFNVKLMRSLSRDRFFNVVYVNEQFKGAWILQHEGIIAPEAIFMYHKSRTLKTCSETELKSIKRKFGAEYAKGFEAKKYTSLTPYYPSFKAFKRQMIATGLPISLISE
ncbi:hypothetical protein SDC9_155933 [bioreactor metagenome]|uniref:Uncharacterized protein n=1 Tax=bioreactor metagenome TaxID=1076179 RepID=A0A645F2U7_9ZZZZ